MQFMASTEETLSLTSINFNKLKTPTMGECRINTCE